MIIKELTLFSKKIKQEENFYNKTLGFEITEKQKDKFSVKIGQSKLTFQESNQHHQYHYCFLIPRNKLNEGIQWLKKRLQLIDIENGRVIQRFESWNADSVYFYDGSGNLAEFIVRYDLENNSDLPFEISDILGVNEIGMPVQNVETMNDQLEKELNTRFWKGDKKRFGTNGTQEGLFLLPNYKVKKNWFPTSLKVTPSPFDAIIVNKNRTYKINFENEKLNIAKMIQDSR